MPVPLYDSRIKRAQTLAAGGGPATELLAFYIGLLGGQRAVDEALHRVPAWLPSGSLEQDLPIVRPAAISLVSTVARIGPDTLSAEAQRLSTAGNGAIDDMLLHYWRAPSDVQFFAKASLQPYGRWLAALERAPTDRPLPRADNRCPLCGGVPQLAIIHEAAARSDGGGRSLACSLCDTVWPFRRILCPNCGEEDEKKLGYFHAPEYDHVRVDACDTCGRYLKAIDVSRLGIAVPVVDEVAAAPLDAWARERGYTKIELNLVGL